MGGGDNTCRGEEQYFDISLVRGGGIECIVDVVMLLLRGFAMVAMTDVEEGTRSEEVNEVVQVT